MDKKQFHQKLKHIYSHTKRGKYDSSFQDISDALISDVTSKSDGGWDESIAAQTIGFAEHIFGAQPELTQNAMLVKPQDAEAELEQFLADRDYSYSHIPESSEQTPDGYIEGFDGKYICEVKSPILMFDHDSAPFGYKFSTTHNKILDAIHNAKKQLEKLDPEHSLAHILIYTSAHPQLNYSSLINAVRGYIALQDGTVTTDLRDTAIFKNTVSIIQDIDLYLWFQVGSGGKFFQASYFSNDESTHTKAIDDLISMLKTNPISSMDNHGTIQAIVGKQ
jgi:hypothetical protein